MKTKIQQKYNKIKFDSTNHSYYCGDKQLISVSALTEIFKTKFDPTGSICAKKALEAGITPREMADRWKENSKKSTDKGTAIHKLAEQILNNEVYITDYSEFVVPLTEICSILRPYLITTEQIIYSESLGIAGTPDILLSKDGKTIDIGDFKTDEEFDKFGKLKLAIDYNPHDNYFLSPLQSIPQNSYYYYALKTSIYRYILEQDGFVVNELNLYHITKNGIKEIPIPYMLEEIKLLLKHYKGEKNGIKTMA